MRYFNVPRIPHIKVHVQMIVLQHFLMTEEPTPFLPNLFEMDDNRMNEKYEE